MEAWHLILTLRIKNKVETHDKEQEKASEKQYLRCLLKN